MLGFLPAIIVIFIMFLWKANAGTAVLATLRMLVQLLAIGYVLIYIFESDHYLLILFCITGDAYNCKLDCNQAG